MRNSILDPDREARRIAAIGLLVAANTGSKESGVKAQRVPAMFMDVLERKLATVTGRRSGELLELYDMLLDCIDVALKDVPTG